MYVNESVGRYPNRVAVIIVVNPYGLKCPPVGPLTCTYPPHGEGSNLIPVTDVTADNPKELVVQTKVHKGAVKEVVRQRVSARSA
jgi:hypothetical protein